MTGKELHARFCMLIGIEQEWPETPKGSELTIARAWRTLAEDEDARVERKVAEIIARRGGVHR